MLTALPDGPSDAVRAFIGARGCATVRECGRAGRQWVGWVVCRREEGGAGEHGVIEVDLGAGWGVVCRLEAPVDRPFSLGWPVAWKAGERMGDADSVIVFVASKMICIAGEGYYADFVITDEYRDVMVEVGLFPIASDSWEGDRRHMMLGWCAPGGWNPYHIPQGVRSKRDWLLKWMGMGVRREEKMDITWREYVEGIEGD